MKIVFMGTPDFAVPTLNALVQNHEVLAVVCQPDRPNARGNKVVTGSVKQEALNKGIRVLQPESVKEESFFEELSSLSPDAIVVVAYGQLLPKEILDLPPYGALNVHGSLLPKYRGAAPIQWSIINGETQTGVTIIRMNEGLDTGDMIERSHVGISSGDTYGSLSNKLAHLGAGAIITALSKLESKSAKAVMQNDAEATYAPLISKELGKINWEKPGDGIVNLIRGLNPSPGAYSELEGKKLKIFEAETVTNDDKADAGAVVAVLSKKGIVVKAGGFSVLITRLQQVGGNKISAADYLKGHNVSIGMMFK